MSLTLSFAHDHLKNERVVLGSASNLNHVGLLGDARVLIVHLGVSLSATPKHLWPSTVSSGAHGFSPIADAPQYCLILDLQHNILRLIPYTRLTSQACWFTTTSLHRMT
jgi:hypothetical protein